MQLHALEPILKFSINLSVKISLPTDLKNPQEKLQTNKI